MKKKAIEKIPYLTLPKVSRKKTVEYVAVTDVMDIAGEDHLFVEVYKNNKECKNVPAVRIVLQKKGFGTFFPETGIWSRRLITADTWHICRMIWCKDGEMIRKTAEVIEKENILYSKEDLERIKLFTGTKIFRESRWWEYIKQKQKDITETESREQRRRRYRCRQQALEERKRQTPKLPKERILAYADQFLFQGQHYLYYKKYGMRAVVVCSACGGVSRGRWKQGETYESQLERSIQEPRMGETGTCPLCGESGTYMSQGRAKEASTKKSHLFLGQRYRETGLVFRYLEVEKKWKLEQTGGKKPEMLNAKEELCGIETARAYFEPGGKIQKDFYKHDPYSGENFWSDCNLSGLANITVRAAQVLPETYQDMKGTFLQYSAMEEFQKAAGNINPVEYLERYIQTPQIEMLVKMGLTHIVEELVKCHYGIVADEKADRIGTFLGIRKEHVKLLVEKKGDNDILRAMQMEKRLCRIWTDRQIEQLAEAGIDSRQAEFFMRHMGIQKLLNYISKYAGCEYGTMCSKAVRNIRVAARTYFDYLFMREELGYDMKNTVYLFPRDLGVAHAMMVTERNRQEADKRIMETEAKYPIIKKNYKRLRKLFYYEDGDFLIRPARDAGEIVMEGRMLHHCVGGDSYLEKHNRQETAILFLRNVKEPEMPYITVEISMDTRDIIQWYGAHDKKPDQKYIDRWLGAYTARLKCLQDGKEAAADGAETVAMPFLSYA